MDNLLALYNLNYVSYCVCYQVIFMIFKVQLLLGFVIQFISPQVITQEGKEIFNPICIQRETMHNGPYGFPLRSIGRIITETGVRQQHHQLFHLYTILFCLRVIGFLLVQHNYSLLDVCITPCVCPPPLPAPVINVNLGFTILFLHIISSTSSASFPITVREDT